MAGSAQRGCGIARFRTWAVLAIAGAGSLTAQAVEVAVPLPHESDLARLVHSPEPVLRGEAALGLALTGRPEYYSEIRDVARDDHPAARVRGTLALGYLGVYGAETVLAEYLLERRHDQPERHAAAFALGSLPDDHPSPAIGDYLDQATGGSYKRHRDTLASLILGLIRSESFGRTRLVYDFLIDESNHDAGLHLLALRYLLRVPGSLTADELTEFLEDESDAVRREVLLALQNRDLDISAEHFVKITRIVRRDRSPAVRAAALRVLIARRRPAALDLVPEALRSGEPELAAACVESVLGLGGGRLRSALENRIRSEEEPPVQAAMLLAWRGTGSDGFHDACFALAADPRREQWLRAAAAGVVAGARQTRIVPVLRRLLFRVSDVETLRRLCGQLVALEAGDDLAERIYPDSVSEMKDFAARLEALFRSGHPDAMPLLRRALIDDRFPLAYQAELLHCWRISHIGRPTDPELAALPPVLAEVLR